MSVTVCVIIILHYQKKNRSLHCISSSRGALSCLCIAELLTEMAGMSYMDILIGLLPHQIARTLALTRTGSLAVNSTKLAWISKVYRRSFPMRDISYIAIWECGCHSICRIEITCVRCVYIGLFNDSFDLDTIKYPLCHLNPVLLFFFRISLTKSFLVICVRLSLHQLFTSI